MKYIILDSLNVIILAIGAIFLELTNNEDSGWIVITVVYVFLMLKLVVDIFNGIRNRKLVINESVQLRREINFNGIIIFSGIYIIFSYSKIYSLISNSPQFAPYALTLILIYTIVFAIKLIVMPPRVTDIGIIDSNGQVIKFKEIKSVNREESEFLKSEYLHVKFKVGKVIFKVSNDNYGRARDLIERNTDLEILWKE